MINAKEENGQEGGLGVLQSGGRGERDLKSRSEKTSLRCAI